MRLLIGEYLRTLREREELDRILPDLLSEIGYVPIARPQTGNRQFGVDLAARGRNPESHVDELLLLVIKQGDIGRKEWDGSDQAVRQSIHEIFDVYLRSHREPQDEERRIHIVVATNGDLKQTVQANWTGVVEAHKDNALIEFWGIDRLSELIESYLLDEHIFLDEDRKELRRALALSGDSDYDQSDLHRLFLRTLGLTGRGELSDNPKTGKALIKALRIVNVSAHAFANWAVRDDGDARQALRAMERALLWSLHRVLLTEKLTANADVADVVATIWSGYLHTARHYFDRLQPHCYVSDGLGRTYLSSIELSLAAFEQIGIIATIGLANLMLRTGSREINDAHHENARVVSDALAALVGNNGICASPCLDRHSQDITLALLLLTLTDKVSDAKLWLRKLFRNVDYAYKAKRYLPIATDSLDDLTEEDGWSSGTTDKRLMNMSWTLATLAGWCAILEMDREYEVLARNAKESYPDVCIQLWHPDNDIYKHLYFQPAHIVCGAAEAPIQLPATANQWRTHMEKIVKSDQRQIAAASLVTQAGMPGIDLIACRHFSTSVPPFTWYQLVRIFPRKENASPQKA